MGYSYGSIEQGESKKRQRPVRVIRYKHNEEPALAWDNLPFTEPSEGLKKEPAGFLMVLQEAFNLLLLLTLALALIIMVVAFAYQMMVAPQVLAAACQNLINGVIGFFQVVAAALPG